jgi:transcriptional regulator with XRE-family HTH domain
MKTISEIAKNQRAKLGLTLDEVGKKAELSQGYLSRLENGDYDAKNLSLDTIIRLSSALSLTVKDFFDTLNITDANEAPALNVYLRKKFDISNNNDVKMIEDLINRLKENNQ